MPYSLGCMEFMVPVRGWACCCCCAVGQALVHAHIDASTLPVFCAALRLKKPSCTAMSCMFCYTLNGSGKISFLTLDLWWLWLQDGTPVRSKVKRSQAVGAVMGLELQVSLMGCIILKLLIVLLLVHGCVMLMLKSWTALVMCRVASWMTSQWW